MLVAALGVLALAVGFALTSELLAGLPTEAAAFAPAATGPSPTGGRRAKPDSEPDRAADAPAAASVPGVPLETIEALGREMIAAGEPARRITVVGAARNVGTTVTAITLARSLARERRVVLVDLALENPDLSVVASDPSAPGMAELIRGSASFGDIITRDRHSRVHVVMAGRVLSDADAIIGSERLAITLEALARSYDHLVIDAGALPDIVAERFAQFAPRAVLVASVIDDLATIEAREQMLRAGFAEVSTLSSGPVAQVAEPGRAQAAA